MSHLTDWADEINERSSEKYDPYEYIESIDYDNEKTMQIDIELREIEDEYR